MVLLPERRSRFSKGVFKDLAQIRSAALDISYRPRTAKALIGNVPFIQKAAGGDLRPILSMLSHALYCLLHPEKETLISLTFSPSGNHQLFSLPFALH